MKRRNVFLINILIVFVSVVFTAYVMNMVYENSVRELKEGYFKFISEDIAVRIETSVELGMDIDNYYGISDILNEAISYDSENMDAFFINTKGEIAEYAGSDNANEMALAFNDSLYALLNGREVTEDIGNKRVLIEPLNSGDKYAYIVIMYDRTIFSKKDSINIISEYRKNVESIGRYTFESFKNSIYALYEKGLDSEDIVNMKDFYNRKFIGFGLVKSVEMGYIKAENNEDRLSETIFTDKGREFRVALNIDRDYINNIYLQTILTFAASLAVCLFIIGEIGSLNKSALTVKRKDEDEKFKTSMSGIIKFLTFFMYLAVYAVLPYGAVIIRQRGESIFSLPAAFTASLPVTLNCIGIFIILMTGDKIIHKLSIKAYIAINIAIGISAMVLGLFVRNTYAVLISALLMGLCLGLEKYIMNYFVPLCSDNDSEIQINFGYYNGGQLAGLALGGSVGGIVSAAKGAAYVYCAGGVIMVVLLPVIMACMPFDALNKKRKEYKIKNSEKTASFWDFLKEAVKRPKLVLDFITACVPLNMGIMFIVSFLPVFLDMYGMSSLVSTYSYILYGIGGSYVGIYMVRKFKYLKGNISAFIAMMIIVLSVFVLIPKVFIASVLISAFLAGLFDGYGGACLTSLPVNSRNAEGIDKAVLLTGTAVTGNIICTLSPVIYSSIINMGNIKFNLIVVCVLFFISGIYILSVRRGN